MYHLFACKDNQFNAFMTLPMNEVVRFNQVEEKNIKLRNHNVIIDSDVAVLDGVETREINQKPPTHKVMDGFSKQNKHLFSLHPNRKHIVFAS